MKPVGLRKMFVSKICADLNQDKPSWKETDVNNLHQVTGFCEAGLSTFSASMHLEPAASADSVLRSRKPRARGHAELL